MNHPGIYKILNSTTGKCYVGSSKNITNRVKGHKYHLRRGTHHSKKLQNSWLKHGEEAFKFIVLEACGPESSVLIEREQFYLDSIQPFYNIQRTAGVKPGHTPSDATRAKVSAALKGKGVGRKLSPEHRAKIKAIVSNRSDETRAKMSAAKKGVPRTETAKRKTSAALTGRSKDPAAIAETKLTKALKRFQKSQQITESLKGITLMKNDVRMALRSLQPDQVREIRSSPLTARQLAPSYGCSETTICKIRRGIIYRDIT